jgi:hypothetical protein
MSLIAGADNAVAGAHKSMAQTVRVAERIKIPPILSRRF